MAQINYLARIHFDFGAIAQLPGEVERLGITRPLLVTDPGVTEAGHAERVAELLRAPAVFADTPANPTEAAALAALALYKQDKCDGVIALGGGSAIDLGKAIGLLATHPGTLADYGIKAGGYDKIGEITPFIAIPTASGTGAEVGRACVMTLETGAKIACVHENLIADVVICDPELTISLPRRFTAATGMDALCHGIETYLSTTYNPPAQAIARDCVIRCANWLKIAADEPDNREARSEMMMAALEGGLCLQKGLGAIHAATLPLGALGLHHGELNAIVMPWVIAFNRGYAADKIVALEQAAGLNDRLEDWCASLTKYLGLPTSLGELGVTEAQLPKMAQEAAGEHLNQTNPKPLDVDEMLAIMRKAL